MFAGVCFHLYVCVRVRVCVCLRVRVRACLLVCVFVPVGSVHTGLDVPQRYCASASAFSMKSDVVVKIYLCVYAHSENL